MSAVGWAAIEDALYAWVMTGASVDAAHAQWAYQGLPIPTSGLWVELNLREVSPVGHDWKTHEDNPDSTGSDGKEILIHARGMREAVVVIQVFGVERSGNEALHTAVDLIGYLVHSYDAIDDAGAGIGEVTKANLVAGQRGSVLEPRARFEIHLHLASEVTKTGTYIQYVQMKMKPKTDLGVTLETDLWIPTTPP